MCFLKLHCNFHFRILTQMIFIVFSTFSFKTIVFLEIRPKFHLHYAQFHSISLMFSPFPDEMVSSCCVVGFTFPQIHFDSNATSVISVWEKRQRFDRKCFSSFLNLVVDSYFERPVLKISHMLLVEIISKIILFHSWLARFMGIPVSHTHVSPPPSSV